MGARREPRRLRSAPAAAAAALCLLAAGCGFVSDDPAGEATPAPVVGSSGSVTTLPRASGRPDGAGAPTGEPAAGITDGLRGPAGLDGAGGAAGAGSTPPGSPPPSGARPGGAPAARPGSPAAPGGPATGPTGPGPDGSAEPGGASWAGSTVRPEDAVGAAVKEWGFAILDGVDPSATPRCRDIGQFLLRLTSLATIPATSADPAPYETRAAAALQALAPLGGSGDPVSDQQVIRAATALERVRSSAAGAVSADSVRPVGDVVLADASGGVVGLLRLAAQQCPTVAAGTPTLPAFWLG